MQQDGQEFMKLLLTLLERLLRESGNQVRVLHKFPPQCGNQVEVCCSKRHHSLGCVQWRLQPQAVEGDIRIPECLSGMLLAWATLAMCRRVLRCCLACGAGGAGGGPRPVPGSVCVRDHMPGGLHGTVWDAEYRTQRVCKAEKPPQLLCMSTCTMHVLGALLQWLRSCEWHPCKGPISSAFQRISQCILVPGVS